MELLDNAKQSLSKALGAMANEDGETARPFFEQAEKLLIEALTKDPRDAQVRATYGRLLEARQRYEEAEEQYERALEIDPTDATVRAAHKNIQSRRQRADQTTVIEKEFDTVTTPVPGIQKHDWPTGVAGSEQQTWSVTESPVSPDGSTPLPPKAAALSEEVDGYWALGLLKLERGELADAEEALKQGLALMPDHTGALKSYSTLLLDQRRYEEAWQYLSTLQRVNPTDVEECLERASTEPSPPLLALRAFLLHEQGEVAAAEPLLREALEAEPDNVNWTVAYAGLLVDLRRHQEATDYLGEAIERGLDHAAIHREYAKAMIELRRYDKVEYHLERARKLDPHDKEIEPLYQSVKPEIRAYQEAMRNMALALVRDREGRTDKAQELFEKALSLDGQHLPTLRAYAPFLERQGRYREAEQMWALMAVGDPQEAEAQFQASLRTRGENSATLNSLARVLINLDRLDDAESSLRRSLALAADDPANEIKLETLRLLAQVLQRLARRQEAEQLLRDHLETVEEDPSLSLQYARLLAARGSYDQAKKHLDQARNLDPTDPEIEQAREELADKLTRYMEARLDMALGWKKANDGDLEGAEIQYKKALSVDPMHTHTLLLYAQLLEACDRTAEARPYLLSLAEMDPDAVEQHFAQRLPELQDQVAARSNYAYFLNKSQRFEEANEQFALVLESQPAYLPALNPYVETLLAQGKSYEAEQCLKRAVEQLQAPTVEIEQEAAAEIYWRYGMLLCDRQRYEMAGPLLSRAAEISSLPRYKESCEQISGYLEQVEQADYSWALGKFHAQESPEEAERLYQEALDIYPEHVSALINYAELVQSQGRNQEALGLVERVLQIDEREERAIAMLADLQAAIQSADASPQAEEPDEQVQLSPEEERATSDPPDASLEAAADSNEEAEPEAA
jgi:tetratricopeptide (TPR) repeat protein